MFHPGHVVPGLDPQLGHQDGAQVLEDPQRLGLAPRTVEGQHALRPQPLTHRVGAGQRLELADEAFVVAQGQLRVDLVSVAARSSSSRRRASARANGSSRTSL